jgi:uroporphyrinogen-III synthase
MAITTPQISQMDNTETPIKTMVEREVKSILITQARPETGRSPFDALAEKYNLKVDFRAFIQVEGLTVSQFRKHRINPLDYTAVIFTSRHAVTHYFRICDELRIRMPQTMKYFCVTEAIALYLQRYVQYRKRKVFFEKTETIAGLKELLKKYKTKETFLYPCSATRSTDELPSYLQDNGFNYAEGPFYDTVPSDLSDLKEVFYDIIVFFSPLGVKSLFDNFPDFAQKYTRLAAWGNTTGKAILDLDLILNIPAPTDQFPSMVAAIEAYIRRVNNITP